jgi:hypothetical protein
MLVTTLLSMVPPNKGCGWAITATARNGPVPGTWAATSMAPAMPATRDFDTCAEWDIAKESDFQSLDHSTVLQVLGDNFVDVRPVDVGVPDVIRIDHHHRPLRTSIQAAGCVDANFSRTTEIQFFDAILGVSPDAFRVMLITELTAVVTLVDAEEYMVFVMAHHRSPGEVAEII